MLTLQEENELQRCVDTEYGFYCTWKDHTETQRQAFRDIFELGRDHQVNANTEASKVQTRGTYKRSIL